MQQSQGRRGHPTGVVLDTGTNFRLVSQDELNPQRALGARRPLILLSLTLLLLLALVGPDSGAPAIAAGPSTSAETIIVAFKPGASRQAVNALIAAEGSEQAEAISALELKLLRVPPGQSAAAFAARLDRHPLIEFAEPNFSASVTDTPNDPQFNFQWDLTKVKAPEAWQLSQGAGIKIAILDTGIDATHPDLASKVIGQMNFSNSASATDVNGHGTHVAGIAAAVTNNSQGIASLGYDAKLLNVKVMSDGGAGFYYDVADGIVWATNNGAKVINLSLGSASNSRGLERAVNYAAKKGVIVVAAAGNGATATPYYPAAYKNVIAVASTDFNDTLAPSSNRGDWVDVAAPGGPIWSTVPNGGYAHKAGTSMAAPHVAGLAALVLSVTPNAAAARTCILTKADAVGLAIGGGRINALKSVQCSP